jgi:CYTH domain-containing protein/predicted ATPase
MTAHIREIVLTGGPCAGKSTALDFLRRELPQHGWTVLAVPEAATTLIMGGLGPMEELADHPSDMYASAQRHMFGMQRDLRNRFLAIANDMVRTGWSDKVVVLYDRAELDTSHYIDAETFKSFCSDLDLSIGQVMAQYDGVVHLVTAADGAADGYTLDNNPARRETAEQAVAADRGVLRAWLGHHRLVQIPNRADFNTKLDDLGRTVLAMLSSSGLERERKWILSGPPPVEVLADAEPVRIVQHYFADVTGQEVRVRARTVRGHTTHFLTVKRPTDDPAVRVEDETVIEEDRYHELRRTMTPVGRVQKTRWVVSHGHDLWEIDHFDELPGSSTPLLEGHPDGVWLAELELHHTGQDAAIPSWLPVLREATGSTAWSNRSLARLSLG